MKNFSLNMILTATFAAPLLFGCATHVKSSESPTDKMMLLEREVRGLFHIGDDDTKTPKVERSKEKSVFVLYANRPAPTKNELYGNTKPARDASELYAILQCDKYVFLELYVKQTKVGYISIGDCTNRRSELEKLSHHQKEYVNSLMRLFPASTDKTVDVRNLGWFYRKTELSDALVHQFPVFLIGHGVLWPLTTVIFSNRNDETYIVQIDVSELCLRSMEQCGAYSKKATDGLLESLRGIF